MKGFDKQVWKSHPLRGLQNKWAESHGRMAVTKGPSPDRLFIGPEGILGVVVEAFEFLGEPVRHRGAGAGDEIAQHRGLLERTRIGVEKIITGTRPAELRDDDPFTRISAT